MTTTSKNNFKNKVLHGSDGIQKRRGKAGRRNVGRATAGSQETTIGSGANLSSNAVRSTIQKHGWSGQSVWKAVRTIGSA